MPQALTILSIRVIVEQIWELTSPTAKDKRTGEPYYEQPPTEKILVALIDAKHKPDMAGVVCPDGSTCDGVSEAIPGVRGAALARLDPGESWEITHIARLRASSKSVHLCGTLVDLTNRCFVACDDVLRPSTHLNTVSSVRTTHMLAFEIIYTNEAGVGRTLHVRNPVHLNSCGFFIHPCSVSLRCA